MSLTYLSIFLTLKTLIHQTVRLRTVVEILLIIGKLISKESVQEPKMCYSKKIYWSLAKENGEFVNIS